MATQYKHLGQLGLEQLLQLMATEFGKVQYEEAGKGLSTNDFTNALLEKLNGIEAGANKYTHATHTAQANGLYKITVDAEGHVSAVTAVAKADITNLGIPGQDTTYVVATQSADGLMSSADKSKIDGIEEGANKYIHATHGAYAAGIYKITVDGEGHVTAASAVTKAELAAIIGEATQSESGLMSAADKKAVDELGTIAKLNEITENELGSDLKTKINNKADKATTLAGYGITDAYTDEVVDQKIADALQTATGGESAAAVKASLEAYQTSNDKRVKAIEDDYLTSEDKEELSGATATAQAAAEAAQAAAQTNAQNITSGDAATLKSAQEYADQKVAAQIAAAYKASGTITYEELPEADATTLGKIFNISNDFTTDADFVEGAGHAYKAGVNVAIVEIDGDYMYDVMAMSFDGFVQEANISEYTAADVTSMWNSAFGA